MGLNWFERRYGFERRIAYRTATHFVAFVLLSRHPCTTHPKLAARRASRLPRKKLKPCILIETHLQVSGGFKLPRRQFQLLGLRLLRAALCCDEYSKTCPTGHKQKHVDLCHGPPSSPPTASFRPSSRRRHHAHSKQRSNTAVPFHFEAPSGSCGEVLESNMCFTGFSQPVLSSCTQTPIVAYLCSVTAAAAAAAEAASLFFPSLSAAHCSSTPPVPVPPMTRASRASCPS